VNEFFNSWKFALIIGILLALLAVFGGPNG